MGSLQGCKIHCFKHLLVFHSRQTYSLSNLRLWPLDCNPPSCGTCALERDLGTSISMVDSPSTFIKLPKYSQRLILPVVNDGPLVSHIAVLLQSKVPLEHGREAVPLEQTDLLHDALPVFGHILQVQEYWHVVACTQFII